VCARCRRKLKEVDGIFSQRFLKLHSEFCHDLFPFHLDVGRCCQQEETRFVAFVDKPFPATAQDRESMSVLRLRREDSSNNSNQ